MHPAWRLPMEQCRASLINTCILWLSPSHKELVLSDESAAAFMEQFYAALGVPNTSKAKALRQAQLALLQDPTYRHPIHWAPYVLVGNWL